MVKIDVEDHNPPRLSQASGAVTQGLREICVCSRSKSIQSVLKVSPAAPHSPLSCTLHACWPKKGKDRAALVQSPCACAALQPRTSGVAWRVGRISAAERQRLQVRGAFILADHTFPRGLCRFHGGEGGGGGWGGRVCVWWWGGWGGVGTICDQKIQMTWWKVQISRGRKPAGSATSQETAR